jgi:parvulin-like peptidyl-prolyl isomerase
MSSSIIKARRTQRHLLSALFALLIGVFALAGCGLSVSSDPLVAARVNGHAIALSAYENLVRLNRANAALQATAPDWQSPGGRSQLYPMEKDALSTLTNLQLMRDALASHNISVPASDVKAARDSLNKQVDGLKAELKKTPDNTALRDLIDSLTPDTLDILAQRIAVQNALVKAPLFPSAHVRGILVQNQPEANDILEQERKGADFTTLAKDHSQDTATAGQGGELGTIYIGQIGPEFSDAVFGPHQTNEKYLATPVGNGYAVFEVTDRKLTSLSGITDAQAQQQIISTWMSTLPAAKVEQFITIG